MKRKKVEKHHYIETRDIWGEDERADGKSNTPSGSARVPGVGEGLKAGGVQSHLPEIYTSSMILVWMVFVATAFFFKLSLCSFLI